MGNQSVISIEAVSYTHLVQSQRGTANNTGLSPFCRLCERTWGVGAVPGLSLIHIWSHRGTESQRSHEVGGADEHLQSSGRGRCV